MSKVNDFLLQWGDDKFLHFSVSASIVLSTQYTLEQKIS